MASAISPEEVAREMALWNEDKSPTVVAGSIILIVTATLAVTLRLISRRFRRLALGADDYMIVLALMFAYGMFISILFCAHYGFGKHIVRVGLPDAIRAGKALYVLEAIYPFCTGSTKLSILLLYRRIFTTNNPHFKYALYTIASILVGWAVAGFFSTVFQCWPVHTIWDHTGNECIDLVPALVALATINTLLNGAVLILPLPMLWNLRISLQQKIGVCGIFVLGSADVVSSILRTYMTSQLKITDVDLTWLETAAVTLAFAEPCVGIICACLPVMRTLFTTLIQPLTSFFSSHARKASERTASSGRTVVAHGSGSQEDVYPLKGMGAADRRGYGAGAGRERRERGNGDGDEERGEIGLGVGNDVVEREEVEAEERGGDVMGGRWDGGLYSSR